MLFSFSSFIFGWNCSSGHWESLRELLPWTPPSGPLVAGDVSENLQWGPSILNRKTVLVSSSEEEWTSMKAIINKRKKLVWVSCVNCIFLKFCNAGVSYVWLCCIIIHTSALLIDIMMMFRAWLALLAQLIILFAHTDTNVHIPNKSQ